MLTACSLGRHTSVPLRVFATRFQCHLLRFAGPRPSGKAEWSFCTNFISLGRRFGSSHSYGLLRCGGCTSLSCHCSSGGEFTDTRGVETADTDTSGRPTHYAVRYNVNVSPCSIFHDRFPLLWYKACQAVHEVYASAFVGFCDTDYKSR